MKHFIVDGFEPLPAQIVWDHRNRKLYRRCGKRCLDVAIALMLLPVLIPIISVLWLLVKLDGGPGFYGHLRIGQQGVPFRCWKIRTMVNDAEQRLRYHLAHNPRAAQEWRQNYKLQNDPRITWAGAFLRKTSLDELPQIWNVLTGQMSLVGPRPIMKSELMRYGRYASQYLMQKPGVTGPWQILGRNKIPYEKRVVLDAFYPKHMSMVYDLWVIYKTVFVLFARTGV